MAKQYVKVSSGLNDVTKPKVKTYETYADFQAALANGDLKEGEYFSIVAAGGVHDDITTLVYQMWDNTPANASIDNKYVVWSDLDDLDLTEAIQRIEAIEDDLPDIKSDISDLETNLNDYKTSNDSAVSSLDSNKVNCSDYNSKMTSLDSDISNITTSITNTNNDLSSLASRVCTNETDISNLKTCAGLNCVGNVTTSALTTCLNNYVTNATLASCGYTTCTGTVTAIKQGDNTYNPENGVVTIPANSTSAECFAGLTCDCWKSIIQDMIDACAGVIPTSPTGANNQIWLG